MAYSTPLHLYKEIEAELGAELAGRVSKALESGIAEFEEQAKALAVQKKLEIKDELTKELVTKAEFLGEMKTLREEMKTLRAEIDLKLERSDRKATMMFLVLLFTMVFVNKETLSFFLKVVGIMK